MLPQVSLRGYLRSLLQPLELVWQGLPSQPHHIQEFLSVHMTSGTQRRLVPLPTFANGSFLLPLRKFA